MMLVFGEHHIGDDSDGSCGGGWRARDFENVNWRVKTDLDAGSEEAGLRRAVEKNGTI